MKINVGDIIEGKVIDLGMSGEGIVKHDAYPIFVPFTLVGEKIKLKVVHAKKDYAFGELIQIIEESQNRVKPLCPYYMRCGGCDLQHMDSQAQLECKRQSLVRTLQKSNIDFDVPALVSKNQWNYRNKLALPFGYNSRSKRVSLGFYEKMTHKVVSLKWCPLQGEWCGDLIAIVSDWANRYKISVYDEKTGKGLLRHLVARKIDSLVITLVINGKSIPHKNELFQKLNKTFKGVSLFLSSNTKKTNVIMGENVSLVLGEYPKQDLGLFSAKVSPKSFFQVNKEVMNAIYESVCEELYGFDGNVIELYSGVGLLTAQLATRLENINITAVEIVKEATQNADNLISSLGLKNRVKNINSDAVDFLKKLYHKKVKTDVDECLSNHENLLYEIKNSKYYLGSFDFEENNIEKTMTINNNINCSNKSINNENCKLKNNFENNYKSNILILDPPRKGCDKIVLQSAIDVKFEKIIYISCNPATLARDLKILTQNKDYKIKKLQPFDMFPQTHHLETLVCLSRKS